MANTVNFSSEFLNGLANEIAYENYIGSGTGTQNFFFIELYDTEGNRMLTALNSANVGTAYLKKGTNTGEIVVDNAYNDGTNVTDLVFLVPQGTIVDHVDVISGTTAKKLAQYDFDTLYQYDTQGEFTITDIPIVIG